MKPQTLLFIELILTLSIGIPTIIACLKGAPFVPTPKKIVREMLRLAKIKEGDSVYDIGCGDGRIVHLASKEYKANAIGFELSPLIYGIAKICQPFWKSNAKIRMRDFRYQDLSDANIIFCYMLPKTLKSFIPKFDRELKKGTRIVSYAFPIGDWKPVHKEPRDKKKNQAPIWVYEIGKN